MSFEKPELLRRSRLLSVGLTDRDLSRMMRRGELTWVRRGAYVEGGPSPSAVAHHRLRAQAAITELAPGAVISHVSAAAMYGLAISGIPLAQVTVTRPRPTGGRADRSLHMFCAPLKPEEIQWLEGVPITSVARTVSDLARTAAFEAAVVAADNALAARLVVPAELEGAVARSKGWPGRPRARQVVAFADGRAESVGESRSRVAIARLGLPTPVLQWEVVHNGVLIGRTDFGWPEWGVIGEFDGAQKYGRLLKPGQVPGDVVFAEKKREDRLRAAGLTVVRWTWADLPRFTVPGERLRAVLS